MEQASATAAAASAAAWCVAVLQSVGSNGMIASTEPLASASSTLQSMRWAEVSVSICRVKGVQSATA
jgi:hypothetical protein